MSAAVVTEDELKRHIRDIPDFPKQGILFRDITPLLQNGAVFHQVMEQFARRYASQRLEAVVAIESRGLIFGAPLADRLGIGLVPVRKAGKLPHKTIKATYTLEYGEGMLEMHADGLSEGSRVVLIDDLLATGGTMGAVVSLLEHFRAQVVEVAFLVELTALGGRRQLGAHPVFSLVKY
ncbi:MAG TPA: adenine phosphoribosyltransferase [Candidatus Omnitrophica bacterium]|nr:MAG: adenine phosphoribosyltransferase [Omnitrophica WOR_2 bacterium GWA2_63_20]OGX17085.1 MAG: adenine phosphoribosyltransferase [Omnitrophica WOR_2 bacterium GWF2_63_9]OGX33105.1 MAG: adenine phosphoribosyltransferase [Omnitrophica WOR_2 bacterium RIFCSPHIGHO2_12_FULL_64_13]OGX35875.1 MAG: adenine phosphoribosyltransferase [Omnitrophica WOR_2 bacterium RIFCSPHIGHO2_02_FULL_63_39]OGX44483.1 MAG: adenine phosphoribosyltransferase [Omnitrophica WOR_2 bacterium RIFCSPLOWO2_02_FULL_63_16]OGX50